MLQFDAFAKARSFTFWNGIAQLVPTDPTLGGHLKTGQLSASRTTLVLPQRLPFRQECFLQAPFGMQPDVIYSGFTWAEDRATQGCDPSADPAAGMAGGAAPPP